MVDGPRANGFPNSSSAVSRQSSRLVRTHIAARAVLELAAARDTVLAEIGPSRKHWRCCR